jgi:hypothetical protein
MSEISVQKLDLEQEYYEQRPVFQQDVFCCPDLADGYN